MKPYVNRNQCITNPFYPPYLRQVVRGHAFPALVPLPLGQRQVDDGVGQQEWGRRDLLDQQPLGAVDRQHALRVVHEVVNSRVPVVEGETYQHVQVRFQHLVAADESTNLYGVANKNRKYCAVGLLSNALPLPVHYLPLAVLDQSAHLRVGGVSRPEQHHTQV